jgi:hypothetical protein
MPKQNRPPRFNVPRAALMTWVFAYDPKPSKGQTEVRDNLKTIHFESSVEGPRKDEVRILHAVATDGHRLIHCWWNALPKDILDEPFEIESEAVDFFLKNLNEGDDNEDSGKLKKGASMKGNPILGRGRDHQFRIQTEDGNYIIAAEKNSAAVAWLDVGLIKHTRMAFPIWRPIVPKWQEGDVKYPMTFGVDFEYVMDFHRYLKEFGHGTTMKISYPDVSCSGPILFAPTRPSEDDPTVDVNFFLLDQATAVEYILMPVQL